MSTTGDNPAPFAPAVSLYLLRCELRDLAAAALEVSDDHTRSDADRMYSAGLHQAYARAFRMAARADRDAQAWHKRQEGSTD